MRLRLKLRTFHDTEVLLRTSVFLFFDSAFPI